jgi:hypothetical protein
MIGHGQVKTNDVADTIGCTEVSLQYKALSPALSRSFCLVDFQRTESSAQKTQKVLDLKHLLSL